MSKTKCVFNDADYAEGEPERPTKRRVTFSGMSERLVRLFCWIAIVACSVAISAVGAENFGVWLTEAFWAVLVVAVLAAMYWFGGFAFSKVAYVFFAIWIALQLIGAHYTFEHVPMDWLTGPLGLERNPFDRIAHTCVGFFAYGVCEFIWRKGLVTCKGMAVFTGVTTIVALAGVWEIIEWIYAVVEGGELGAAFLGSQGDIWDAQKDILCDTLGAIVSSQLWRYRAVPQCSLLV